MSALVLEARECIRSARQMYRDDLADLLQRLADRVVALEKERLVGMTLARQAAYAGLRDWQDFGPDLSSGPGWVLNAIDALIADEQEK